MIDYAQALLVACIRDEEAFFHAKGLKLRPAAFEDEGCAAVWDCLCRNAEDGAPHSKVELWMRLKREYPQLVKQVEATFSLASAELDDTTHYRAWAEHVAKEWIEKVKRQSWDEATDRVQAGESVIDVTRDVLEKIAVAEDTVALEEQRLERQREAVLSRARDRIRGTGDVIRTGIRDIDRQFGLFQSHEFIVLAARPGVGKSSLARQIMIEHVRDSKRPVMLFSLEMGVDQVVQAMASMECGVSSWRIEDDFEHHQERLIAECERFAGALGRFFYVRDDVYKIGDIEHEIHMAVRRHKPSIIIIDYLQLVEPPHAKGMNREQQVAYMSRRLKQAAQMHRVPIIALSQMSREYEKDARKPRLSDLRESGALEQDADRVWFIHHDPKDEPVDGILPVTLIQEKCRGGSMGEMRVGFKKSTTKFMFDLPMGWENA